MKTILFLSWRYLSFNKLKSGIMIACLTITIFLPLTTWQLISYYDKHLTERSDNTPLLLGAKSNRFDLLLKSLYFETDYSDKITFADIIKLKNYGKVIPLHLKYKASPLIAGKLKESRHLKYPLVGTSFSYFRFRKLEIEKGTFPLLLGDVIVGWEIAQKFNLNPGDYVLTVPKHSYDLAGSFQLKMKISGILNKANTPDDNAFFIDLKTSWIIDGLAHGHQKADEKLKPDKINQNISSDKNKVLTGKIINYQEITPENIDLFHTHESQENFPLTSAILIPKNLKSKIIALANYSNSETRQLLEPLQVTRELMRIVFKVKLFFDLNFIMISVSTILFILLIILLSQRMRKQEMFTLYKLGCSESTIFKLQISEVLIILIISSLIAILASYLTVSQADYFLSFILNNRI